MACNLKAQPRDDFKLLIAQCRVKIGKNAVPKSDFDVCTSKNKSSMHSQLAHVNYAEPFTYTGFYSGKEVVLLGHGSEKYSSATRSKNVKRNT